MLNILVIKLLDTFFNIKPKWCHSRKCASPVVFPFKRIRWVSFIYKGQWGILEETPMTRGTKLVKQMLLHACSSLTMLSQVTFVIVPSWPELVNSLADILHYTLITGQKVEQTSFISIKSVIYYVSLSSHNTDKSWCLTNIYADLTAFSTTHIGSYGSFCRIKFTFY